MITYKTINNIPNAYVKVFLEGKIVGRIIGVESGGKKTSFQYFPNGSTTGGEVSPTIQAVKRTL